MIIAQENLPLSLWKMENNLPDCLVVGFIFYVYVWGFFFFFIYILDEVKRSWQNLSYSVQNSNWISKRVWVCVCVCEWEGGWGLCESPVCNKSWLLNPAPELTLKQIHSCVWVPTFSHYYTLIQSWTQGNLYGLDGCVVGHCVVLSTAEHSDIYCLCTGNWFWHTPST